MPPFGPHLYDSDLELLTLDLIAKTASPLFPDPTALCSPLLPSSLTLRAPIDPISVIRQLESGVFNQLLHYFKHQGNDVAVILLGCVGMELGVRFSREDTLVVKMCVMRDGKAGEGGVCFLAEGRRKEEVLVALEEYANTGTPWVFRRDGVGVGGGEEVCEKVEGEGKGKGKGKGKASIEMEAMKTMIQEVEEEIHGEPKLSADGSKYANPHTRPSRLKPSMKPSRKDIEPATPDSISDAHRASWFPSLINASEYSPTVHESDKHTNEDGKATSSTRESMFALPGKGISERQDAMEHAESCYHLPCPKPTKKEKGKVRWKDSRKSV